MFATRSFLKPLAIGLFLLGTTFLLGCEKDTGNAPPETAKESTANPDLPDIEGISVERLEDGEGDMAIDGDKLTVSYVGQLEDGTVFDQSQPGRESFTFTLGAGGVIQGWQKGLQGVKKGERRKLTIAPAFGYGTQGAGEKIPPNATLIFYVDILDIQRAE